MKKIILLFLLISFYHLNGKEKVSPISDVVKKMGDTKCANRVDQISNFFNFGQNSGAILMTQNKNKANSRLIPLIIEQPTKNGTSFVSATFMPKENSCEATYDAYNIWDKPCWAVGKNEFSNFKRVGELKKQITVLDGGEKLKIFLIQAGEKCISIKKEIIY